MRYLCAYFLSVVVTHIGLGPLIRFMHRTSGPRIESGDVGQNKKNWRLQDFWVGGTERAIVTTLVIFSPTNLPLFIGGWVAAKLAAGWSRYSGPEFASAHLISLVGSALSIAAAIAAGLLVAPNMIEALNAGK